MKDKEKRMTQEEMCRRCPDFPCEIAVEMGIAPKEGVNSNLDIQRWERIIPKDNKNRADADRSADMENREVSEKSKATVNAADGAEMTDEEKGQEILDFFEEIIKEISEDKSPEAVQKQMVNDMVYLCSLVGSINSILYYLSTGRMDPFTACQNGNATVETADRVLEKWQVYSLKKKV